MEKIPTELFSRVIHGGPALLPGSEDTASLHPHKLLPQSFWRIYIFFQLIFTESFVRPCVSNRMMIPLDPPALQGEFCPVSPSAYAGILTLTCFPVSASSGTGQHWKDLDVFAFLLSLVSRKKKS